MILPVALLRAEETYAGGDVAALLQRAKQGEVKALLEVAEHFLGKREPVYDSDPVRNFPQVEKWLLAAAAKGSADASSLLGRLYLGDYPGVPRNEAKALGAYEKAARGGSERAMLSLANHHLESEGRPPDPVKAEQWLRTLLATAPADSPLRDEAQGLLGGITYQREQAAARAELAKRADTGDREAQYELAQAYFSESGEDSVEGVTRLRQAAEGGHADAQYDWASRLYTTDPKAAEVWLLRAVAQNHGPALGNLGLNYLFGTAGTPRDPIKGIDLISRAVVASSPTVAMGLNRGDYFPGLRLADAQTLRYANQPASLSMLTAAAERGEANAQFWLGHYLELANGAAATAWFAKAAAQGHPGAMMHLGLAYHNGSGVARDLTQAYFWLTRAALLTNSEAQWRLAYAHLNGQGTPADAARARYWFKFSANSLPDNSPNRDDAKKKAAEMTGPQLTRDEVWTAVLAASAQARLPGEAPLVAAFPAKATPPAAPKVLTLDEHRAAAEKGDVESMFQLGLAEIERRQIESNKHTGPYFPDPQRNASDFRWIMAAARAGHPEAQFLAATHWLSAEPDAAKKAWLEKAAAQNHAPAQERLAALTKDVAVAAKQAATDRDLAAQGDADAAFRLFRARIKEIATTVVADSIAAQNGQPVSGKNYRLGYLDAEMSQWMDLAVNGAQLDSLAMLHDYFRDEQPETAYLLLLLRRHLAQTEFQLALPKDGFGTNSQEGFLKAFALLGEKLSAEQRGRADALFKNQWSGPWLDNRLGTNFEFGLCGFPQDRQLAHAFYRRAAEAGFRAGQVNLARCYELGIGVVKDPALARTWSATAAAQSSNHEPTSFRISESIKQKPASVASVKASLPVKVDELDLLRSKVGYLQGQTVLFDGKVYQVPEKIQIATLNDEVLLTAIGGIYTYSSYHSRSIFGTRILTETTTKVRVRDLIRFIENVSGAYIVTEVGPCKACAGQASFWDVRSKTRTGCNNCGSTGCVPTAILNNGSSRAY